VTDFVLYHLERHIMHAPLSAFTSATNALEAVASISPSAPGSNFPQAAPTPPV